MTPEQIEKEAEIYAQVQHGDPAKFPGLSKSEIYQSTKDDFTAGWEQCANWAISQLPPAQRWVKASERMPLHGWNDNIWRKIGKKQPLSIGSYWWDKQGLCKRGGLGEIKSMIIWEDLEWLEEVSAPSMDRIVREHGELVKALTNLVTFSFDAEKGDNENHFYIARESASSLIQKIESNGK